ncbi:unnamed protein product [Effrenium voratum]|nr:unnamed protein product [Effrenium voratum]
MGKIYGVMDDLRLENERVQQKYIAMTKLLIDSTDIDGYRVDTPMQVPLNFYKVWAPAIRAHAKTLGKENMMPKMQEAKTLDLLVMLGMLAGHATSSFPDVPQAQRVRLRTALASSGSSL